MTQYISNNEELTCIFTGRLDTMASQVLDTELKTKLNASVKEVIFDMKDVEYISSSFLRICLKTLSHTGSEKFGIVNVSPTVLKVFQIANLNSMIRIG